MFTGDQERIDFLSDLTCMCQQLLLILVIKRTPYSSRLGTVWYHAQQIASSLNQTLSKAEYTNPQRVFGEAIDQAFDTELDKLLL